MEDLWQVVQQEGAQYQSTYSNTIRGAARRIDAAKTQEPNLCQTCVRESFPASSSSGNSVMLTLVRPANPIGVVLVAFNARPDAALTLSAYDESLLKNDIGLAFVHIGSHEQDASTSLIAAAREISIRQWASPRSLFLRGSPRWSVATAKAVTMRPELFRGLMLNLTGSEVPILTSGGIPDERYSVDTLIIVSKEMGAAASADIFQWVRGARCSRADPPAITAIVASEATTQNQSDVHHAQEEAFVLARLLS